MHWFFIAIISPLVLSIAHHTDKYLLSKISKESTIGSLIIFSTLFPILALPFLAFFGEKFISFSFEQITLLVFAGLMSSLSLLLYFHALEEEETSMIVPMFQLMPVFGYILGIIVLNEQLEPRKILACLVVILGATLLSFELEEENKFRFKIKPTLLMVGASLFLTFNDVIFKKVALDIQYTSALFWNFTGYGLFAVLLLVFATRFRHSFITTIKLQGKKIISLNLFNELLQTIATATFSFALLLAPVVLVLLTEAYQPIFVLFIGVILTKYFPHIATEKISRKHMLHKTAAITTVVIGSIFVYY